MLPCYMLIHFLAYDYDINIFFKTYGLLQNKKPYNLSVRIWASITCLGVCRITSRCNHHILTHQKHHMDNISSMLANLYMSVLSHCSPWYSPHSYGSYTPIILNFDQWLYFPYICILNEYYYMIKLLYSITNIERPVSLILLTGSEMSVVVALV